MGEESADEVGTERAHVFDHDARHEHDHHEHDHHRRDMAPYNELAIVGVVTAVIFWPVGLLTSLLARREVRRRGERGGELALVGVVLSALSGLAWSIILVVAVAGVGGGPGWGRVQISRVLPAPVHIAIPSGPVSPGPGGIGPSGVNPGGPRRDTSSTSAQSGSTGGEVIGGPSATVYSNE